MVPGAVSSEDGKMVVSSGRGVSPQELKLRIARQIRLRRKARGLTQEQVAVQADIGWRHLQKIEAAEVNVTLRTLCSIAAALGIDPAVLVAKEKAG